MIMETKKCSNCGHEFPIKYFATWIRKDGTIGVLHQCKHCQHKEANKRYSEKKKFGEVAKFETRVLIEELNRRGFQIKDESL